MGGAALRYGAREETLRPRRPEERRDAEAAGRLSCDGDPRRVAAEAGDVVPHPLERRDLVQDAVHAGGGELGAEARQVGEAQRPQAIVDGDGDDVAVRGEALPVVPGHGALAGPVAAAMDPHEYRAPPVVERRRLHVQRQAVLVPARWDGIGHSPGRDLRRSGAELARVAHAAPALVGRRRPEPPAVDGRGGIRNAGEQQYAVLLASAKLARAGLGDRGHERSLERLGFAARLSGRRAGLRESRAGGAAHCAHPPENGMAWPAKKLLSSLARNTASSASSRAVASRPAGTWRLRDCTNDSRATSSGGKYSGFST